MKEIKKEVVSKPNSVSGRRGGKMVTVERNQTETIDTLLKINNIKSACWKSKNTDKRLARVKIKEDSSQ